MKKIIFLVFCLFSFPSIVTATTVYSNYYTSDFSGYEGFWEIHPSYVTLDPGTHTIMYT